MPRQTIRYASGRAVRQTRRNHRAGIMFGGRASSIPGHKITGYVLVIPVMIAASPFRQAFQANRAAQTNPSTWPAPYAY